MGHNDLMQLYPIVQECKRLESIYNWGFKFEWDQGDFETRIDISEDGVWSKGSNILPVSGFEMFCPDIVEFSDQFIIEFEEEAKPNTGYHRAKKHKGHFQELLTVRDEIRDKYYKLAGFEVLKIWESDGEWKVKLKKFLVDRFHQR